MFAIRNKIKTFYLFLVFVVLVALVVVYTSNSEFQTNNELEEDSVQINDGTKNVLRNMHKLVHFDLKGAPPKMKFFKDLVAYLKWCGATGLLYASLIEYNGY
jgi:hypothetical protein